MSERQLSVGGSPDWQRFVVTFPRDPLSRQFELAVVLRTPPHNSRLSPHELPTIEELAIIQARTMLNWSNVMASILFDVPLPEKRIAGIKAVREDKDNPELAGVPESDGDMPYCTVFNLTNFYNPGVSVTIHSYDDGTEALKLAQAHKEGFERFGTYLAKNAESANGGIIRVYQDSNRNTPPASTPKPPTGSIGSSNNPIGRNAETPPQDNATAHYVANNAFIRSTKAGMANGLLSIETGKTASPSFNTQAMLANEAYDYKNISYDDGVLVAYGIAGNITVHEWEDAENEAVKIYADIPVSQGGNIRIYDNPESKYNPFTILSKKLGIPKVNDSASEALRGYIGKTIGINAAYIVMKVSESDGKKYSNFYGFYHAPEGQENNPKHAGELIPF